MVDPSKPFPDSRPSGIYPPKSGFSVAKFLGLTVALAAGAGAGVVGYMALQDGRAAEDTNEDEAEAPAASPDVGTAQDEPDPKVKKDVPPVRPADEPPADSGPMRLDIPAPWGAGLSDAPGDEPGPDVEVPAWE